MMFLLVILAGMTLFMVGYLVGCVLGYDRGERDAYQAVERWHDR